MTASKPEQPRRLKSAAERRQYILWVPHLWALARLEYRPTGQKKWILRCPACGTPSSIPNPRFAASDLHHEDCVWMQCWLNVPQPFRGEFESQWIDTPILTRKQIRGLEPPGH